MKKHYVVRLSVEERQVLHGLVHHGREAAYRRKHAQVLLLVDEGEYGPGKIDREVAENVGFSRRCVEQIRERCMTNGLMTALERKKHPPKLGKLDGEAEARLVNLACSGAPEGRARWTLRLLAERLVELEVVDSVSRECVRQVLKKHYKTLAKTHVVHSA